MHDKWRMASDPDLVYSMPCCNVVKCSVEIVKHPKNLQNRCLCVCVSASARACVYLRLSVSVTVCDVCVSVCVRMMMVLWAAGCAHACLRRAQSRA